jgi:hypothetical protein
VTGAWLATDRKAGWLGTILRVKLNSKTLSGRRVFHKRIFEKIFGLLIVHFLRVRYQFEGDHRVEISLNETLSR